MWGSVAHDEFTAVSLHIIICLLKKRTMKKLSLLFVLLVISFIAQKGSAQSNTPIGQRNYVGVEAGLNYGWQSGAENFVIEVIFPFQQGEGSRPLPLKFSSLGSGVGLCFGATVDLNLSEKWNINGRVQYSTHTTKSTEVTSVNFKDSGVSTYYKPIFLNRSTGTADFENTIKESFNFIGVDILARYQILPDSWYAFAGIEINSILSNKTSLRQSILSSTNGVKYKDQSGVVERGTEVSIPEQSADSLYKSLWLGPKFGVGIFIPIGSNGWVLTPEISLSIPLSDLYFTEYRILKDPAMKNEVSKYPLPGKFSTYNSTTPKLWFAGLSVALKFPLGNFSTETESDEKPDREDAKRGKE
jgi:hypothetical protein